MRRSFTLLEAIIAAALLATLAASAVSGLSTITAGAERAEQRVDVGALSMAVDTLLDNPMAYKVPLLDDGAAWDGRTVVWPDAPGRRITVRRLVRDWSVRPDQQRRCAWLIFESDGAAVARWLPLREPRPEQAPEFAR
ncbi:MAG: hypothetical protein ACF8R7_00720 [Phycisphaerales bacterium JB039]